MGGFSSVVCSLDTGQTKIEWKRYDGGSGISTYGNLISRFIDTKKGLER